MSEQADRIRQIARGFRLYDSFQGGPRHESTAAEDLEAAAALEYLAYCPGIYVCDNCELVEVRSVFDARSGNIAVDDRESPDECANGCGPVRRLTWRERAVDAERDIADLRAGAKAAPEKLEDIGRALHAVGTLCPDVWPELDEKTRQRWSKQALAIVQVWHRERAVEDVEAEYAIPPEAPNA